MRSTLQKVLRFDTNLLPLSVSTSAPSIAEQVGKLREALWAGAEQSSHNSSSVWTRVAHGELPLVVEAHKADHIAQLLLLKSAFEEAHPHNPALALVVSGAQESHRLASELADANVPVLLNAQTRMQDWDDRRALPGPPLSKLTELSALVSAGVLVGIQIEEGWQAANLLWDATWAALDTDGLLKEEDAVALVSTK